MTTTSSLDFVESEKKDGFFETPITTSHVKLDVYLTQSFVSGSSYTCLEQKLRALGNKDIVNFYVGSFGGSCHALIHLISAIKACRAAEINMIVVSPCYSAGATIALVGTSLTLEPHTFLMFHNYSSASIGKGGELVDGVLASDKWIRGYFKDIHYPFLTKQEDSDLAKDQDIYVYYNDKDVKKRIDRHFKVTNKARLRRFK